MKFYLGTTIAFINGQPEALTSSDSSLGVPLALFVHLTAADRPRPATEESDMLRWALIFLIVALVAAIFGFGGIASGAAGIAKLLFVLFLVIFVVSLIMGLVRRA